jgi:two-component sensor histidine kinase/ABC-type amino acid transport substrate-binding protein
MIANADDADRLRPARRCLHLLAAALLCIVLTSFAHAARTVRVGVFPAAPLVLMQDGKPAGLFIDLVEYFATALDWRVEYVPGTWTEQLARLEKGEIDLLPAVGFTTARTAIFDFSKNPVYIDSGVLFTNPKFTLHTVHDLQGKRVAALRGSIFTSGFLDYIASFGIDCDIILTSDNRAVMQAITNGTADAGVCIYSLGNELAKEYTVSITAITFSPIALEFAVPKGKNADLINGIDRLMVPMLGDPESLYSRSFRAWTKPAAPFELPTWFWVGISGLVATGLFLAAWNSTLKAQVHQKTKHLEAEIAERRLAEEKITQALHEKEALIRELYHRTKNTMQIIQSMVELQAADYPESDHINLLVKNTRDRIQAISLVHNMLYSSRDLSKISIAEYVRELTALILRNAGQAGQRISLDIHVDDHLFLIDTAIPFGLILNELMTNSLRHAFPDNRPGTISIALTREAPDRTVLRYADNGVGVPSGFAFRAQDTLGLQLIHNLGELQLMGNVQFDTVGGLRCTVDIPLTLYTERVSL